MAARQIMNMTLAIGVQKLNVAQVALGVKKIYTKSFHDNNKCFQRYYDVESKQASKLKVSTDRHKLEGGI